jgi:hypothetical protein
MLTTTNSPLEFLAAFAIAFAAGVLATVGLAKYVESIKKEAGRAV